MDHAASAEEALGVTFSRVAEALGGDEDLIRLVFGLRLRHFAAMQGEDVLLPGCVNIWIAHGCVYLARIADDWSRRDWLAFLTALHLTSKVSRLALFDFIGARGSHGSSWR